MLSNRSMPAAQVIPELAYPDVGAAVEWLCRAFGFSLRLRIGDHRAQLEFGSGAVIIRSGAVALEAAASHSVMVRVEDVDAHYTRAVAAGAKAPGAPTTYPYGERQYAAQDLSGRWWVFSQSVVDVPPSEWGGELVSKQSAA
jgi:uncharacterized glyoxalase superfamily protein PhnB